MAWDATTLPSIFTLHDWSATCESAGILMLIVTGKQKDTTSYPVLTSAIGMTATETLELSSEDFANTLQRGLRETTFHPNQKKQTTVDVIRNASNLDFLGYKIAYNQANASTNNIPANGTLEQFYAFTPEYPLNGS